MKQNILGTAALCVAAVSLVLLVSSWTNKEGVYNPKKKIVGVYESYVNHDFEYPKSQSEKWVWSGGMLQ